MITVFRRESLPELEANLKKIDADIAAHPLAAPPVKQAQEIIEAKGEKDNDAVARELADRGLPSLEELGKIQLQHTGSWWRLHRDRNKIVKQISKLNS